MYLLWFCLFFCFTSVLSTGYWPEIGKPLDVVLKTVNKCDHRRTLNLDVNEIKVHFYDLSNNIVKPFAINEAAHEILSYEKLDKTKKIIMFVGGFRSNINNYIENTIRNAFRTFPNSYLIIINHSAYTHKDKNIIKSYERSVQYVYYIGKKLAQFLTDLYKGGISAKNIHCIGHSLGGQMLGHTGENFIKATGQNISRITALDPAGPCFSNSEQKEQIRAGVANYVEVYHCYDGGLGTSSTLGDVDFFVNEGKEQPYCRISMIPESIDSSFAALCNHRACVTIWAASVTHHSYTAYKCNKYKDFKEGRCYKNKKSPAGFWNPGNAYGVYYFSTSSKHN